MTDSRPTRPSRRPTPLCALCDNQVHARDLCRDHYDQWYWTEGRVVTVTTSVPNDLAARIDAEAARTRQTRAATIRQLLSRHLGTQPPTTPS